MHIFTIFREERKKHEEETKSEGVYIGEPWLTAENVNYHRRFDLCPFDGFALFFIA